MPIGTERRKLLVYKHRNPYNETMTRLKKDYKDFYSNWWKVLLAAAAMIAYFYFTYKK